MVHNLLYGQNFKGKCSFCSFKSFYMYIPKKKNDLKKVNISLEALMTWMFTSSFQILTCVYLRTKLTKKLNRNLTEEENSSKWSQLLSQVKVAIKKKRMGWQRMIRKVFVKKKSEWILRFQIYLEKRLCFALPFAVYKDQRSSSQTQFSVFTIKDSGVQYSTVRTSKLAN